MSRMFNMLRRYTPLPSAPSITETKQLKRINHLIEGYAIALRGMADKTPYIMDVTSQSGRENDLAWTNANRPFVRVRIMPRSNPAQEHIITLQPNADGSVYFHDERRQFDHMGLPNRYSATSTAFDNTQPCFFHLHKRLNEIMPSLKPSKTKKMGL